MKQTLIVCAALLACTATARANDVAPGGTLRAIYLGTNPAQAVRDAQTGEYRGPAYELAKELAARQKLPLDFKAAPNPPAVIEAVRSGQADIGFVAYEATRLGTVDFSQVYLVNLQSFLVREDSPIKAIGDVDQAGRKIAGTVNDSVTLCMKRVLKIATIVELPNDPVAVSKALLDGTIDAFGASRQRLTVMAGATPGTRILAELFFTVPQNVITPKDRPAALAAVNALIDDTRASGFLQAAIDRGGATGVAIAPADVKAGCPG